VRRYFLCFDFETKNKYAYLFQGYFRKGEVELKLSSYNEALESYNKALSLQPNEPKILEAMSKASRSLIKDRRGTELLVQNYLGSMKIGT